MRMLIVEVDAVPGSVGKESWQRESESVKTKGHPQRPRMAFTFHTDVESFCCTEGTASQKIQLCATKIVIMCGVLRC